MQIDLLYSQYYNKENLTIPLEYNNFFTYYLYIN